MVMAGQKPCSGRRCCGLTLIEVMIATMVVALGFAGILGTATQVMRMVRMAREETQAAAIAQHVLETIKTYSWIRLSLMLGESDYNLSTNNVLTILDNPTCIVTVSPVTGEIDRLRFVSARIRWQRSSGDFGERELASYVARKKRLR